MVPAYPPIAIVEKPFAGGRGLLRCLANHGNSFLNVRDYAQSSYLAPGVTKSPRLGKQSKKKLEPKHEIAIEKELGVYLDLGGVPKTLLSCFNGFPGLLKGERMRD